MTDITPRRIEWQGPEGFKVILDEDGVWLRSPKGDGLEPGDLNRLLEVIVEAKRARDAQSSPIPLPPALEQRRYYPAADVCRQVVPDADDRQPVDLAAALKASVEAAHQRRIEAMGDAS